MRRCEELAAAGEEVAVGSRSIHPHVEPGSMQVHFGSPQVLELVCQGAAPELRRRAGLLLTHLRFFFVGSIESGPKIGSL
eukprot:scaffold2319_cov248-Pinguiococcus_pyrenoidosus.AAC.10